jgi:hypothetical protein
MLHHHKIKEDPVILKMYLRTAQLTITYDSGFWSLAILMFMHAVPLLAWDKP